MSNVPIRMAGWTIGNYDSTISHVGVVTRAVNNRDWHGDLGGLDPNQPAAHIEFDIADPIAPAPGTAASESMSFDNVAIPSATAIPQPENYTYTTQWGTVLTFKSLLLTTNGNAGAGSTRYTFTVSRTRVQDDRVVVRLMEASDGGAVIDGIVTAAPSVAGLKSTVVASSGLISPGAHKSIHLEFRVDETAQSPALGVAWRPVEVSIPLTSLPHPTTSRTLIGQSYFSDGSVQYSAMDVTNQSSNSFEYLIYAKSPDKTDKWCITDAEWTNAPASLTKFTSLITDVRWHIDGSPLLPGEFGARFISIGRRRPYFPLAITAEPTVCHQHSASFSNVPVPAPGQFTILNQSPDGSTGAELKLRSIKWITPDVDPDSVPPNQFNTPYTLKLEFIYTTAPNALASLALLTARDIQDNSLGAGLEAIVPPTLNPIFEDPNRRVFTTSVSIPPHSSKTINLNVLVTAESPTANPVRLSIDGNGEWSLISAANKH